MDNKELLCKGAELAFKELSNTISNSVIIICIAIVFACFLLRAKNAQ